ncbi:ABC transporter permease [Actinosynnema sp. NPDC020468]|uniref:ABC transporter permease n=1 Tax=Actinosynnema sp. NPDC020468 TaxID=3154488 RepID=UPI0033D50578
MQIPWRAAPRAALSSPLTLLVGLVTALLIGFVTAAAVLHPAASGSAAVAYQADRLCAESLRSSLEATVPAATASRVLAEVAERTGGAGVAGRYTREARTDFGGRPTFAKFGFRPGATDHLTVLQGGAKDGLWVPESIARTADVKVGDRGLGGALPPVTAIYQDVRDPLAPWWCSERAQVVPNTISRSKDVATAVVWMPSAESFAALPPAVSGLQVDVTVRFPAAEPRTLDEAAALLATGTESVKPLKGFRVMAPLAPVVENARQTAANVRSAILPLTLISLLIGLAGVATVTAQWGQRRHAELRLLWVRGSGPAALGGRAVLELGLPLLLGGAAGLGAARLLLPVYAPSDALPPGAVPTAAWAVAAVVAASLVVTWASAALRAHRVFQAGGPGRARGALARLPWELATAGVAVWAWSRVRTSGLATPEKIGGLPRIDAAALAFPLLVVLTAALLAARLVRWGLRASHRASLWSTPTAQLALRRLAAAAGPVTGVLLVGVLAVGTIAVGSGVAGSQRDALELKSGMYAGANTTAQVSADTVLPDSLKGSATIVGLSKLDDRTALVVDPATFGDGAFLHDIPPAELATPFRVGDAPRREVAVPGLPPLNPTAHRDSFPKVGTSGWVVPRAAVTSPDAVGSWYVWTTRSLDELTAALTEAGVKYRNVEVRSKALQGLPFLTIQWTFGFVTAIGAVLAVVAAIALLLAVEVRRRQNAVSGAFSTRMGLRPSALLAGHLLELGAVAVAAVAVGLVSSGVSSGIAVPRLDPAPRLTPTPALPDVLPLAGLTVAGSALVVLAAAWIAVRSVRTAGIGELIRG